MIIRLLAKSTVRNQKRTDGNGICASFHYERMMQAVGEGCAMDPVERWLLVMAVVGVVGFLATVAWMLASR
jgi:hypothetical protein